MASATPIACVKARACARVCMFCVFVKTRRGERRTSTLPSAAADSYQPVAAGAGVCVRNERERRGAGGLGWSRLRSRTLSRTRTHTRTPALTDGLADRLRRLAQPAQRAMGVCVAERRGAREVLDGALDRTRHALHDRPPLAQKAGLDKLDWTKARQSPERTPSAELSSPDLSGWTRMRHASSLERWWERRWQRQRQREALPSRRPCRREGRSTPTGSAAA